MIGRTLHNFRIISVIGEGGMGVVYLAEHRELPKRFAIKSLSSALSGDPRFRERFYREAQNQALLDHPNIVQVTDFFEEDNQFFLVMEYVDGQDLSKLIKTRSKLSQKEAVSIFVDILKGVEFAHSKGIIHRDVKPSNVLIDKSGRARIMDFGIAILAGAGNERLTATGTAVGSPWYMSPEQIRHPQDVDRRSDIYSLGIVLYEMLTGEVPFDGETDFSIKDQQINSPVPDPRRKNPEISPELVRIIVEAMAKDPRERFQDCREFLQRFKKLEIPPPPPKWQWCLVLTMLAGIGIFLYLRAPVVPPDDDNGKTLKGNGTEVMREQRQVAFNLIQSASEKARFLCLEFERVKQKENFLETVEQVGERHIDTSKIDSLKKQIQDHGKNIEDAMSGYTDFITQLAGLRDDIVEEEFGEYAGSLEKKESFAQIHTTRLMKDHYQQYRNNRQSVNTEVMHKACVQELG